MTIKTSGENRCLSRTCGYQYMTPSYILDEQLHEAASYPVIGSALLENSSAHGFPTLYKAEGDKVSYNYFIAIIN